MKEFENETKKWKDILYSSVGSVNTIKMNIFSQSNLQI